MRRTVIGLLVASVTFAVGGGPTVSAKGKPKTTTPTDAALAMELHHINHELAKANPVYKGHRADAMHLIHKAVRALENHAKVKNKSKKPAENKHMNLPRNQSDALLTHAVKALGVVQAQLASAPNSTPHAKAAADVRKAITELEKALAIK